MATAGQELAGAAESRAAAGLLQGVRLPGARGAAARPHGDQAGHAAAGGGRRRGPRPGRGDGARGQKLNYIECLPLNFRFELC